MLWTNLLILQIPALISPLGKDKIPPRRCRCLADEIASIIVFLPSSGLISVHVHCPDVCAVAVLQLPEPHSAVTLEWSCVGSTVWREMVSEVTKASWYRGHSDLS